MAYSVSASGTVYDNLNHLFTNAESNITIMTPAVGINNRYFLKNQIFPITIGDKVFDKDNHTHLIDDVIVKLEQEMFETGVYVNIIFSSFSKNFWHEIFSTESAPPSTPEFRRRMPADADSPPFAPMKHQFTDHTEVNEDSDHMDPLFNDTDDVDSDSSSPEFRRGMPADADSPPFAPMKHQFTDHTEVNEDSDHMDSDSLFNDTDDMDSDSSRDSLSSLEHMFVRCINRLPDLRIKE